MFLIKIVTFLGENNVNTGNRHESRNNNRIASTMNHVQCFLGFCIETCGFLPKSYLDSDPMLPLFSRISREEQGKPLEIGEISGTTAEHKRKSWIVSNVIHFGRVLFFCIGFRIETLVTLVFLFRKILTSCAFYMFPRFMNVQWILDSSLYFTS